MNIIFPSAQKIVCAVLNGSQAMGGVRAATKVPSTPPATPFIKVSRVGGDRIDIIMEDASVLVEVYGMDEVEVDRVARTAQAVLLGLSGATVGDAYVYDVALRGGILDYYAESVNRERSQFTAVLRTKGSVLL